MLKTMLILFTTALLGAPAAFAAPETDVPTTTQSETMQTDQNECAPTIKLNDEVDTFDYSQLDAGIRETVRFFRSEGYHTCDSGDGTKAESMECALDKPMVALQVPRDRLAQACDNILQALAERGIEVSPWGHDGRVTVQGSYDPTQSQFEAVIVVVGLNDELLAGTSQPEYITRRGTSCPRCVETIFEPSSEAEAAQVEPQLYGQIGYEAYARATDGKAFDGRDLPMWFELPDRIQQAWTTAASAIRGAT